MMKKLSFVLLLSLVLVGCGDKIAKYEETMNEYVTTYYNAHMKGTEGLTTTDISIKQLKDSAGKVEETYDMSKLEKCKDSSYIELTIDEATGEIINYTYHMECE